MNFQTFQKRVNDWMLICFGAKIAADIPERNHRFLEEALELVQSAGCTKQEAYMLVDYVFNRPVGDQYQEVGGAMVTLVALCTSLGLDMCENAEIELSRINTKIEQIRQKHLTKPASSPLPQ